MHQYLHTMMYAFILFLWKALEMSPAELARFDDDDDDYDDEDDDVDDDADDADDDGDDEIPKKT